MDLSPVLTGFSVYFFLKAHELGRVAGQPADGDGKGTSVHLFGQNPRTGCKSGFGDVPALLFSPQALIDAEFRSEDIIDFPTPGPKDKRAKKPSPKDMSDEDDAQAWENHRQYL